MKSYFKQISIELLQAGQYQPRTDFDEESLKELSQSIASQGLIEPLVVREIADNIFEIIAGERRWRAAKMAGMQEVPCIVGDYNDEQACAVTLIENIQRQDLNLIEEAKGYQRLIQEFHFQQDEIAAWIGKSRSHIANILRLLKLSSAIQNMIRKRELSLGHARLLIGLDEAGQCKIAEQIISENWSVRKLEEVIKEIKLKKNKMPNPKKDKDVTRLESLLSEQLGAPVQINQNTDNGGWVQMKFYDNDTLAGILDRLGLEYE